MRYPVLLLVLMNIFCSSPHSIELKIVIQKGNATILYDLYDTKHFGNRLSVTESDSSRVQAYKSIYLPYPVYQFAVGDINYDGVDDIFVGVIKSTYFDPVVRKRLFVYTVDQGYIIPMWLGSRVGFELHDFRLIKDNGKTQIRTLEKSSEGEFLIGLYQWSSFGPKRIDYTQKGMKKNEAIRLFFR